MKWQRGQSGNPRGRPAKGQTITAILEGKLDKESFVQKLIELANGGKDIDPATQLGAMRLILGYVDGLPVGRIERDENLTVKVLYVEHRSIETASVASGPTASIDRSAEVQLLPRGPSMGKEHAGPSCADARIVEVSPGGVDSAIV